MALNATPLTRRNFVSRAGLLVSGLGLSSAVQAGLMEKIVKKAKRNWGAEALAADTVRAKFFVEILFRAGLQFNCLFPSAGHMDAGRGQALNFYSSQNRVMPLERDGRRVYFAQYTAGDGADRLRNELATNPALSAVNVATSETVDLQDGQHTGNFAIRSPNNGMACPAVLHSQFAPARPVQAIEWNNGAATTNARANFPALSRVQNGTQFEGLFRDLPMYFTFDELKVITGTIENGGVVNGQKGSIGRMDDLFIAKAVQGANEVATVSLQGRGQAQISALANLQAGFTAASANFTDATNNLGGVPVGQGLAYAAAAFSRGLASTFTISMDSGDWHGDIPALDDPNSKQGRWNRSVGNALAGLWRAAAALPDPDDQSKTVADGLLVSLTSEFTRTANRNGGGAGNDNGDGGTQAFVYMGKMVKNGSFGNITKDGETKGFDPTSLNTLSTGPNVSEAMMWRTTARLLGIPASSETGTMGSIVELLKG